MLYSNIGNIKLASGETQDPIKEPYIPAITTDTSGNVATNIYVNGAIVDDTTGEPLKATITLVVLSTGKPFLDQPAEVNGQYDAWTTYSPDIVGVKFIATGYETVIYSFSHLLVNSDVLMHKSDHLPWVIILLVLAAVFLVMKKNKRVGKIEKSDITTVVSLIGGILAVSVVQKLLVKFGLLQGPGEHNTVQEQTDPNSAFKPDYWRKFTSYSYAITESDARDMASTIYNAFHVTYDDYEAILSVFSRMRTKANVSFLSWVFTKEYSIDLLTFLTDGGGILPWDGLSDSHLNTIIQLVRNLPTN